jgi:hypothetical protein
LDIERIGILYLCRKIEEIDGVSIYQATIFGRLADRLVSPYAPLQLTGRVGLHRNVFVVGRADCKIVIEDPDGVEPKFEPVEGRNRIRPTLRKARNTAKRVAPHLSEWECWLRDQRDEKQRRLEKVGRFRPLTPQEVAEETEILAAFEGIGMSPVDEGEAAISAAFC